MVRLETERLVLRQFREDDLEAYRRMVNNPEAMLAMGDTEPRTREQCWRTLAVYLGHWAMRGYGPFAVEEKASGAFVGRIGPWLPEGWPGLELIWAVDRAHWGRGFATEAGRAARDWVLARLDGQELISLVEAENLASKRVAEKLGAVHARDIDFEGLRFRVYRHAPARP
jgi:RimJ/RimL family protein N-acetyltransferase